MHSSKCQKCGKSYGSKYHQTHCAGKTVRQYRASRIGRSIRQYTPRRTAGEIFASQRVGNMERGNEIEAQINEVTA